MTEDFDHYEDDMPTGNPQKKYLIAIIVLAVLLMALTYQYFRQVDILRGSEQELTVERDTLVNRLSLFAEDISSLRSENDTINQSLITERQRADSLITVMKNERRWSVAKIKKYEKELGTMRTVLKGYVMQIDSLNQLNNKLSKENVRYKKELNTIRNRAESAEENAQELRSQVRKGSVITARDIDLKALNAKDKEEKKAKRASRLRVDLVLNGNPLAQVGEKDIYVRIKGPSGAILSNSTGSFFMFEDQKLVYSAVRSSVDYQGEPLAVSLYYTGQTIEAGTYSVDVYMDGYLIGSNEIILQ